MEEESSHYVDLISEDNRTVRVSRPCLGQIGLVNSIIKTGINDDNNAPIKSLPLAKIKYSILIKIAEYLEQHADDPLPEDDKKRFNTFTGPPSLSADKPSNGTTVRDNDEDDSDYIEDQDFASEKQSISEEDEDSYFLEYIRNTHNNWDEKWIRSIDIPTLIEICRAANYLYMTKLLDLTCQAIADHMKGLDVEGIRKKFNIENDFTPEEEAKIKEEFAWAEE
jgi:hypothetical protein